MGIAAFGPWVVVTTGLSSGSAIRRDKFVRHLGRTPSPLRSDLGFRYTQVGALSTSPPDGRGSGRAVLRSFDYGP